MIMLTKAHEGNVSYALSPSLLMFMSRLKREGKKTMIMNERGDHVGWILCVYYLFIYLKVYYAQWVAQKT